MLKITGIDKEKLTAAGFTETPNGFSKVIPNFNERGSRRTCPLGKVKNV